MKTDRSRPAWHRTEGMWGDYYEPLYRNDWQACWEYGDETDEAVTTSLKTDGDHDAKDLLLSAREIAVFVLTHPDIKPLVK